MFDFIKQKTKPVYQQIIFEVKHTTIKEILSNFNTWKEERNYNLLVGENEFGKKVLNFFNLFDRFTYALIKNPNNRNYTYFKDYDLYDMSNDDFLEEHETEEHISNFLNSFEEETKVCLFEIHLMDEIIANVLDSDFNVLENDLTFLTSCEDGLVNLSLEYSATKDFGEVDIELQLLGWFQGNKFNELSEKLNSTIYYNF